jgi:hypothetical protein
MKKVMVESGNRKYQQVYQKKKQSQKYLHCQSAKLISNHQVSV